MATNKDIAMNTKQNVEQEKRNTVLICSNDNEMYKPFVEPVAKAWENMGFNVMVITLDDNNLLVDKSEVPSANQAQMIRMLWPALHPDTKFITTDVDMLPLNREYFHEAMELVEAKDDLINLSADAYPGKIRMPICYFAGYGSAFSTVTGVSSKSDISIVMKQWWSESMGLSDRERWATDEKAFTSRAVLASNQGLINLKGYARGWPQGMAKDRIDRGSWHYDLNRLMNNEYIDSHMLRPLENHKDQLAPLFEHMGVKI